MTTKQKDHIEKGSIGFKIESEEGGFGKEDALRSIGKTHPIHEEELNDELACQRGNGEIEMLETNRWNSKNDTYECGNDSGCRNRKPKRKV
jgi:hypothetical protein